MYIHTHTDIHTCRQTCIHTDRCIDTQTYDMHACMHAIMQTHTHTRTRAYTYIHIHIATYLHT